MKNMRTGAAAALLVVAAFACDDPARPGGDATLVVIPGGLSLLTGAVDTLHARDAAGDPVTGAVTWSTSDGAVVAVNGDGEVTAMGPGTATVTAVLGDLEDAVPVEVSDPLGLTVLPIGGTMNQDWYLTNYVDLRDGSAIIDYTCGPRSYDGHLGLDLVLPSFAAMDEGVAVLAAAPGTVSFVHDGEYDRNKAWSNAAWNVVWVDHGGGYEAAYGHLMRNSIRVTVGQQVAAGDTLGMVGSSGRSDMPHLHFELHRDGNPVDTFAGPCGEKVAQWEDPIAYQDEFHFIQAGAARGSPDLNRLKDPPPSVPVLSPGDTLVAWAHYHNARVGATNQWTIRRPDGSVARDHTGTVSTLWAMSWWWYWTDTSDLSPAGTWTIETRYDGALVATSTFELAGAAALRAPGGAAEPSSGTGGGGIR